ncbi:MAG: 1,4-alpha-glucan branching enzyme, partial [Gammaproteobacteria bacterium]|nr:1,4-alpha-glucan branching enzyme [Gammaproteobacteria bacterium]
MTRKPETLLQPDLIEALMHADYADAFALLGMHQHPEKSALVVRALLPGAVAVDVIASATHKKVASLNKIHDGGLYEGVMGRRSKRFDYYFKVDYQGDIVVVQDPYRFASILRDEDLYLFCEGTQERVYQWMGAHVCENAGISGTLFVLWAPEASRASVVGDFNQWDGRRNIMRKHPGSGVWEFFVPDLTDPVAYKYELKDRDGNLLPLKSDPYAFAMQHPP